MAITYEHLPIDWDNEGIEPTQDLIENGFVAGYKPPAEYFNAILNRTAAAITEIQSKTADLSVDFEAFTIDSGITDGTCTYTEPDTEAGTSGGYTVTAESAVQSADYFCIRFLAPNDYVSGATFTIGTTEYTAVNAGFKENDVVMLNFDRAQQKCFAVGGGGNSDYFSFDETAGYAGTITAAENANILIDYNYTDNAVTPSNLIGDNVRNCLVLSGVSAGTQADKIADSYNSIIIAGNNASTTKDIRNSVAISSYVEGSDSTSGTVSKSLVVNGVVSSGGLVNHGSILAGTGNNLYGALYAGIISGQDNTIKGKVYESFLTGYFNTIDVDTNLESSIMCGRYNTISETVQDSIIIGNGCTATGENLAAFGNNTTAKSYNFVIGKYNKTPTAASASGTTGDLFIVGNGLTSSKTNAFRVAADGGVYGTTAYTASGADYAEMFQYADDNAKNEDRRGLFVTLDGEKIRLANADDDYILGVVSATPSVVADAQTDDWCKKWKTDIFGERLLDENGAWILNEDFKEEENENYVSRLDRKEWAAVGLVGKLIVVDDGTCEVNGYCKPKNGGVATKAETGYRVMKRLDDTHIQILFR